MDHTAEVEARLKAATQAGKEGTLTEPTGAPQSRAKNPAIPSPPTPQDSAPRIPGPFSLTVALFHLGRAYGLSKRELQAVEGQLKGMTRQETADALGISVHTLNDAFRRASKKMGTPQPQSLLWG